MGSRSVSFSFTPGENEQIETCIVIPEERRSIIHGIVKDPCNKVIKDAVVKLYEKIKHCNDFILKPITHTFTDECGQFVFGPLVPCKCYVIKVWVNDVKIRELVIHPDKDDCTRQSLKSEDAEDAADETEIEGASIDPMKFDDEFEKIDMIVKMQSNATCTTYEISDVTENEIVDADAVVSDKADDLDE